MSPINALVDTLDIQSLKGVTQDSRQVEAGYLFAALQGVDVDGRDYIDDALRRGASVILSDDSVSLDDRVRAILVDNPRQTFSHIVSEFYGQQPKCVVAVTGTNGKSSVVHFADQLWRALGKSSTYIGTLSGNMTTPDPVALHGALLDMSQDGITHVALEASSHGLEQYRMDGVHVSVAAFTSFSQDHLDYHADMDGYFAAKLRLFSDVLQSGGVAVLNADISEYESLRAVCSRRGVRVLSYGKKGDDIKLISCSVAGVTQKIDIEIDGKAYSISLPLVGEFQAMNVLCALGCVLAENPAQIEGLVAALEMLEGVPGRLQHVNSDDGTYHAYVDYAHTPDALENVLTALRPHVEGRLICVFGCGGDRDKAKRALMGEVVARLADIAIVTDDNPRSESPADIRAQILETIGANASVHEIAGRRDAIAFAVGQMKSGDILLVAGKGHEQGQIFDGVTEPFDDVCETRNALRNVV